MAALPHGGPYKCGTRMASEEFRPDIANRIVDGPTMELAKVTARTMRKDFLKPIGPACWSTGRHPQH